MKWFFALGSWRREVETFICRNVKRSGSGVGFVFRSGPVPGVIYDIADTKFNISIMTKQPTLAPAPMLSFALTYQHQKRKGLQSARLKGCNIFELSDIIRNLKMMNRYLSKL